MTILKILTKDYQIRFYEVDPRARLRPVTILDYLQDAAGSHTRQLGISVADLRPRRLTWVLSRTHARFLHYPHAGTSVRVATWPSGREGLFALRDFEVRDQEEKLVALATTSWAVVDTTTGRPVRLDQVLPEYPVRERRALTTEFQTLPKVATPDTSLTFRVRRTDLDVNQHVNNTIYPVWALEAVPNHIEETHQLTELEIGFRAPVVYGDCVISKIQQDASAPNPTFLHQLVSKNDNRELTRLRSVWTPRN